MCRDHHGATRARLRIPGACAWPARLLVACAFAAGLLAACAPVAPKASAPALVWPDATDAPPRMMFVKAFSRPDEFGIEKGFLERLGEFLFGQQEARLVRPMAVVSVDGVVYVADPGAKGVHRFDAAAGRYDLISSAEAERPLASPVGLAVGGNGEIYVADSARPGVLVIRPGSKTATPLALPQLSQPTGIALDPASGRLYVADTSAHRVAIFNPDGTLHASIGGRGEGDGEFNYPTYLWRDARGRLYVTDSLNFRVQVFDAEGRFLRKFGKAGDGTGDFMRQKGVATDSYGHVYIVDALMSALQIYDEAGTLLLTLGNLGQDRGEFWLPSGLFIGDGDEVFVADAYNRRVQVFRYIGGPT